VGQFSHICISPGKMLIKDHLIIISDRRHVIVTP
jgi:hypothetical protein